MTYTSGSGSFMTSSTNGRKVKQLMACSKPPRMRMKIPSRQLCLCVSMGCSTQHMVSAKALEANAYLQQLHRPLQIDTPSGTYQDESRALTCGPNR